jgi:hypothetical protein
MRQSDAIFAGWLYGMTMNRTLRGLTACVRYRWPTPRNRIVEEMDRGSSARLLIRAAVPENTPCPSSDC